VGVYYQLACKWCGQYISFGKKLHRKGHDILQGLYSEEKNEWIRDERAFQALQAFLLQHEGHQLTFALDNTQEAQEYEAMDIDSLLKQTS
jgi:hypothetical protein